jgi:hypothetical protein
MKERQTCVLPTGNFLLPVKRMSTVFSLSRMEAAAPIAKTMPNVLAHDPEWQPAGNCGERQETRRERLSQGGMGLLKTGIGQGIFSRE